MGPLCYKHPDIAKIYFNKDYIFLQLYYFASTVFLECPSSQLLHCPIARLDKQQGKKSTKADNNLVEE